MIYLCPACGGKLSCDQDMMEGDGERLKGFVELGEAIECGHCKAKLPAAQWVAPREPAGDLAVPENEPDADEAAAQHPLTSDEIEAPKAPKAARKAPKAKREPKA